MDRRAQSRNDGFPDIGLGGFEDVGLNYASGFSGDIEARIRRLEKLAGLMDARFSLGGIRFGLDSLIGLVPGIGDAATAIVSSAIVYEAWRLGVPRPHLFRMAANVAVDAGLGTVPVLGDLFDVGWKANIRNTDLIRRHADPVRAARRAS